jgi:hypothetical protein
MYIEDGTGMIKPIGPGVILQPFFAVSSKLLFRVASISLDAQRLRKIHIAY